MPDALDRKNLIAMKLLHYFIIEKNYNPIILQGAENEIWLENFDGDYKIVRIVFNHIHNEEQLDFDMFKTRHVVKKIKKKTFSLKMNVLSIFTDIEENVKLENKKDISCISLYDEKDISKYQFVIETFPDITKKMDFTEEGFQLFMKITADINKKNKEDADKVDEVFKKKKPIITPILIAINVIIYFAMVLTDNFNNWVLSYGVSGQMILGFNEWYRLITGGFLHSNIIHLFFNMYSLYIIGTQMENFMGKIKYTIIYFFSMITASLLSVILTRGIGIGASGAIFGLLGSLAYFGYYYRVYLGTVLKSQIIPLIILNLVIGFVGTNIDNFAHIGGLIGGVLITMGLGVKYKSNKFDQINGLIVAILFLILLIFISCNYVKFC